MKLFSSLRNQASDFLGSYKTENPATYAAAEQAIGAILIADGLFGIDNPFDGGRRSGIFGTLGTIAAGSVFMFIPFTFGNQEGANLLWIFFVAGFITSGAGVLTFIIRLLSIIFGWKLLKDGRKSAASLPAGTNSQTMIDEIKGNFTATVFGFGRSNPAGAVFQIPNVTQQSTVPQDSQSSPTQVVKPENVKQEK